MPVRVTVPTTIPAAAVATANVERDVDLLFMAADNYFNLTGLTAWLTQNRAWLQGRRIAVSGLICDNPALQTLARDWPDIALLGFVEDLSTVYARSRVALAPVEGTGLKIKVVEALEHGTPVLGSQHALAALPSGYEECVLPLSRENVERLLDEPGALHRAELAAARYMAEFRSAGDRDRLLAWLAAAMGRPSAPTPRAS